MYDIIEHTCLPLNLSNFLRSDGSRDFGSEEKNVIAVQMSKRK